MTNDKAPAQSAEQEGHSMTDSNQSSRERDVRLKARELWHDAVARGDDYPCKYWGIADCFYHYGGGCLGGCRSRTEYIEKAKASPPITQESHHGQPKRTE